MNRFLQIFNFLGVVALAVLCAGQWQMNSRVEGERREIAAACDRATAKVAEQEGMLKEEASELERLRGKVSIEAGEVAAMKARVDQWNAGIRELTSQRDEVGKRYEDLVGKYNELVDRVGGK